MLTVIVLTLLSICVIRIFSFVESWLWRVIWLAVAFYAVFGRTFPGGAFVVPLAIMIAFSLKETMEDHGIKWK
jgi:hypothetical protein